jgi:hypothetical protein
VRSTLLASSVRALQTRGDYERYLTHLPERHHKAISELVAGVWLPFELGEAHYTACNKLGYGAREFAEMGRDVGNRIHGTILATAVRLAKESGVTPWTIYSQFGKLWERIFVGGGLTVRKLGPKEALVEVVGNPLVSIPYYHGAQKALFLGLIDLFCTKAYAADVKRATSSTATTYRFAWA